MQMGKKGTSPSHPAEGISWLNRQANLKPPSNWMFPCYIQVYSFLPEPAWVIPPGDCNSFGKHAGAKRTRFWVGGSVAAEHPPTEAENKNESRRSASVINSAALPVTQSPTRIEPKSQSHPQARNHNEPWRLSKPELVHHCGDRSDSKVSKKPLGRTDSVNWEMHKMISSSFLCLVCILLFCFPMQDF